MPADVYFADVTKQYDRNGFPTLSNPQRVQKLFDEADLGSCISEGDMVAIKIPFGGLTRQYGIHPFIVSTIIEEVKKRGGIPFIAETYAWHFSMSWGAGAPSGLMNIARKGYTQLLGAPLIFADGIKGVHREIVPVDGLILKEAEVAGEIYQADAMIAISHLTGHPMSGYAAALKNIGMGCSARRGKAMIHAGAETKVVWNREKCTFCLRCTRVCANKAISYVGEEIQINRDLCIGCGDCTFFCPTRSLRMEVISRNPEKLAKLYKGELCSPATEIQQIKLADAVKAILSTFQKGKVGFITDVTNVTYECDCSPNATVPVICDVGFLASKDPLAIDKAAIDLAIQSPGYPVGLTPLLDDFSPGVDKLGSLYKKLLPNDVYREDFWRIHLEAAAKLGVGELEYNLKRVI